MTTNIEISRRLLLINSCSSVLRKVLMISVMVWVYQYLIVQAGIPAEEYALLPVLMALMAFLPLVTALFMAGVRRYVTVAYARGDEGHVTELVSTMFKPLAGLALLIFAGGLALAINIDRVLTIDPSQVASAQMMFALLISLAALRVILAPLGLGIHLRQKFLGRNVIGILTEAVRIAVLLWLLSISARVLWVVVATVSAGFLELVVMTAWSMRLAPALRYRPARANPELAKTLFTFGGWSVLTQIGLMIRDASDPLILNEAATATDVGAFHFGSIPDTQSRRVYLEAYATAQPMVMAMHATDQKERLRRTYFRMCRYSLWIMLAFAMPLIACGTELYSLYLRDRAGEYAVASTVMALLLARAFVIFPNSTLGMIATAQAKVREMAVRALAISLVNLALTLYLVGWRGMGALGSALSTALVTFLCAPTVMWPMGLRFTDSKFLPWARASIGPGLVPALFGAPVWFGLCAFVEPANWTELGLVVLGGALVYVAALVAVAMRPEDRVDMGRAIARLRGR